METSSGLYVVCIPNFHILDMCFVRKKKEKGKEVYVMKFVMTISLFNEDICNWLDFYLIISILSQCTIPDGLNADGRIHTTTPKWSLNFRICFTCFCSVELSTICPWVLRNQQRSCLCAVFFSCFLDRSCLLFDRNKFGKLQHVLLCSGERVLGRRWLEAVSSWEVYSSSKFGTSPE